VQAAASTIGRADDRTVAAITVPAPAPQARGPSGGTGPVVSPQGGAPAVGPSAPGSGGTTAAQSGPSTGGQSAPTTSGVGGARKPHGSAGIDELTRLMLDDDPVSERQRRWWADELDEAMRRTPPVDLALGPYNELRAMVVAAIALLRGESPGPGWGTLPPVVLHQLSEDAREGLVDPALGIGPDATHVVRDGAVHIYATTAIGVMHELVEAVTAPAAGVFASQAHTIATIAERIVEMDLDVKEGEWRPRRRPDWLTARASREITEWAGTRDDLRNLMVLQYQQVLADIEERFDGSPWADTVLAYAAEFHEALIEAARPLRIQPGALQIEFDRAIAELREFGKPFEPRGLAGWNDRRKIHTQLDRARPRYFGQDFEKKLNLLRENAERHGIPLDHDQLLAIAARWKAWEIYAWATPYEAGIHDEAARQLVRRWPQIVPALYGTAEPSKLRNRVARLEQDLENGLSTPADPLG
jgi:hypothetical protein